jgi:hypothetical protein
MTSRGHNDLISLGLYPADIERLTGSYAQTMSLPYGIGMGSPVSAYYMAIAVNYISRGGLSAHFPLEQCSVVIIGNKAYLLAL